MANKIKNEEVEKKEAETTVEVKKADLEVIMKKLEDQSKTIDLLYQAADKGRLAKAMWDEKGTNVLIRTAKISKYEPNGKLIIGWKLTKNQSEIINGRWIEDQKTMLVFEDGETAEISLLDFYRYISRVSGEIISRTQKFIDGVEDEILKISLSDGRTLEISSQYVN